MRINTKILLPGVIVAIVITCYAIFMMPFMGKDFFPRLPGSYYQQLTQGFLFGQLNMSEEPSPKLARLQNPYDPAQNAKLRVMDLTYYHNKYYLYFGPLPIFTYFLPIKLITGFHGAPALAVAFFATIGFIFNFLLLIKIRNDHFPTIRDWQLYLCGLMIGFANNSTFLIYRPRTYEIAIVSAYAVMSIALYYLYKIFKNTFRIRDYIIFSTTVAATVAGRPQFTFVCIFLVVVVAMHTFLNAPKQKLKTLLPALLMPCTAIGVALAAYNYLRFDSIFEFGHRYQLGKFNYLHLSNIPANFYRLIPLQLYYYFFQPSLITKDLYTPELPTHWLASLTPNTIYEPTIGLLATAPIVLMILYLVKFIRVYANNKQAKARELLWFQATTVAFTAILFAILCLVYYTSQRYITDFLPYLLISAIINLWFVQTQHYYSGISLLLFKAFTSYAIVSGIVVGLLLGALAYHPHFGWVYLRTLTFTTLSITSTFISLALAIKLSSYVTESFSGKPSLKNLNS